MRYARVFTRYILAWFGMMVLAVLNGTVRDFVYLPWTGQAAAHQISSVILIALFALYFRWLLLGWPLDSGTAAWLVGAVWCAMTVLFEWGLGVRRGMTAGEIFAAYDLSSGQLWALIPLWVLVGPYVMRRWTGKENASVRR